MKKGIFILSTLLLLIIGIVLIMHSSYFEIKEILVVGNEILTTEQIIEISGISKGQNLFLVPGREVVNRLMNYVRIKGIKFERNFPDQIVIQINERTGLMLIFTEDGRWIELDQDGQILETFTTKEISRLPIMEGLNSKIIGTHIEMTDDLNNIIFLLEALLFMQDKMSKVSYQGGEIIVTLRSKGTINFGQPVNLKKNIQILEKIWENLETVLDKLDYIKFNYEKKPVIRFIDAETTKSFSIPIEKY
ncbi:MAG: FtsQ-type POTRA domain-containing protein [Halanaerobiales bacterium]|nr:FtsQ-type POTRA domain-containing protein [Halanaerobiales bacterium]